MLVLLALLLADLPPYAPTGGVQDKSSNTTVNADCSAAPSIAACPAGSSATLALQGMNHASVTLTSTTNVGNVIQIFCGASYDSGTAYLSGQCGFVSTDHVYSGSVGGVTSWSTSPVTYDLSWSGTPTNLKLYAIYTSGSVAVRITATAGSPFPAWVGSTFGVAGMPQLPSGVFAAVPMGAQDSATPGHMRAVQADASGPNLAIPSSNVAASATTETAVDTVSTVVTWPTGARSCAIQNNGPNKIYCNPGGAATTASFQIPAASFVTVDGTTTSMANLHCIAATALQVTGSATVLMCVK